MPSKHAQSRLKKDHVIWLATCGQEGRPHAVPAYVRKYRELIERYDWTPKEFSDQ